MAALDDYPTRQNEIQTAAKSCVFPSDLENGVRFLGISKREYFAALNLAAILSINEISSLSHSERLAISTNTAVRYADALIEALNKPIS